MSLTSLQGVDRAKHRKLNGYEKQKTLDLPSIHRQIIGRKKALSVQRRQYEKWLLHAKKDINSEICRRQKELDAFRVSAHKEFDKINRNCEFQIQTLTSQLKSDIELAKSLQSLKAVEHDGVLQTLELAKRTSKAPTLNILPTVSFKEGKLNIKLSEVCVKSLSERISETLHRCFSSGVAGLVASYVDTAIDFEGRCCLEYKGHGEEDCNVYCVVGLSGGRIAIGYKNGSINVWESKSGKHQLKLENHSKRVTTLAVVDDNRLLSGSADETLRLWDLRTGQLVRMLRGHTDGVTCACVFTDAKGVLRAASGSWDTTIRIWDLDTGGCLRILRGHTSQVQCVSVTTDGQRMVSGSEDESVSVWDTEKGECSMVLQGHTCGVTSVVILDTRNEVVAASSDNTLRVWNMETGECLKVLKNHTRSICSVSVFMDNRHIISGSSDNTMRVWNMDTRECIKIVNVGSSVWRVCCLKDGRVVSVNYNSKVQIWE